MRVGGNRRKKVRSTKEELIEWQEREIERWKEEEGRIMMTVEENEITDR